MMSGIMMMHMLPTGSLRPLTVSALPRGATRFMNPVASGSRPPMKTRARCGIFAHPTALAATQQVRCVVQ